MWDCRSEYSFVDQNGPEWTVDRLRDLLEPATLPTSREDMGEDGLCMWMDGVHMANRMRNATIRQKRPMASDRAKPRMA